MNANETALQEAGLQFFGKLSASVSHDLKNVLSIINEKAGLLEDFCHMARRGAALDMDRIDAVTTQVKEQVARADQIIRCFNRFAHSTDHPVAPMDLGESVATLVQLAQRLLAQMEVVVDVQPNENPVVVITRPLMALEVIWAGMQWVAGRLDAGQAIDITVERSGEGARVLIGPVASRPAGIADAAASIVSEEMTQALQAELSLVPASGMLQIQLAPLHAPP
jgi:light-regulated signal transduction histidine kinase (bacteriophytochrome)